LHVRDNDGCYLRAITGDGVFLFAQNTGCSLFQRGANVIMTVSGIGFYGQK
jgi:hypothetical protein